METKNINPLTGQPNDMITPLRWTDSDLDHMRTLMDPPADIVAADIFKSHDIRGISKLLTFLSRNDAAVDMKVDGLALPQPLQDYFNDLSHFQFTKEEKEVLDRASDIFELWGPVITLNLALRSLLKQYAATKATNVLRMTTLLTAHTDRRVTETFQFVLDVMQKKWYEPDKRGIRSIQKLRLIHALIRFRILHGMTQQEQGQWEKDWGMPINQEDMIFANQTFSVEVIQGLEQAGINLSEQEKEDFFQAWVLIGRALGVNAILEPANYREGVHLQQKIYDRQFTLPNHNGPALAAALVTWLNAVIPFPVTDKSIITFIKFFNGVNNYEILEKHLKLNLGEPHENFHRHVHQDLRAIDKELEEHNTLHKMSAHDIAAGRYPEHVARQIVEFISIKILRGVFERKRGSKSTSFQIDDALADRWGLPGNEGIPEPDMPPLNEEPKKRHPILQVVYDLGAWVLEMVVKVRQLFSGTSK